MIAKITGTVQDLLSNSVIIDVAGVGYEVFITNSEKDSISINKIQTFYIAENIKEDDHTLYGFLDLAGRSMYYQLTSVSGVGPKAAMSILAAHSTDEVAQAILQDNIALFSAVSGIGKKTAQRIILDLKGKLVDESKAQPVNNEDPAYQALLSLGYKSKDAQAALNNIATELSTQERVKLALKGAKP